MGQETLLYHKNLAAKIAEKKGEEYAKVMTYIRSALSNLAVRSALLCLRGSRGKRRGTESMDLAEIDFNIVNSELTQRGGYGILSITQTIIFLTMYLLFNKFPF